MPHLIGLGAAGGAAAVTLVLGVAFWPPMDKIAANGKAAVEQPVFVASAASIKPLAPAATATPAVATDNSALAKLAIALKSDTPPPAPAVMGATRSLTLASSQIGAAAPASEAARRLCAQGLVALAAGDIAGGRLFLERAAEAGDARALMALGASYEPATLARMGAVGIKGDAAKARDYYARALAAGMGAAKERMAALDQP